MDSFKELFSYINRRSLPGDLQHYYIVEPGVPFDLMRDNIKLKRLLLSYSHQNKNEEQYTYIFLAILGYYIGEYKLTLFFIRKLESFKLDPTLWRLVMELKYNIRKLDKIVILTSNTSTTLNSLKEVARYVNGRRPYGKRRLVLKVISTLTIPQLAGYFRDFEQVYLVGHGNDDKMTLGTQDLTPDDILNNIKGQFNKPNVLGILSCGNAFRDTGIREHVDYFITDNLISTQIFSEMFLYGYLRNFYSFFSVPKAFDAGRILPVIRATAEIDVELFEKGIQIRP